MKKKFERFLKSDNVIKTKDGYLTQCSQYGKLFSLEELYVYFKKNYTNH